MSRGGIKGAVRWRDWRYLMAYSTVSAVGNHANEISLGDGREMERDYWIAIEILCGVNDTRRILLLWSVLKQKVEHWTLGLGPRPPLGPVCILTKFVKGKEAATSTELTILKWRACDTPFPHLWGFRLLTQQIPGGMIDMGSTRRRKVKAGERWEKIFGDGRESFCFVCKKI